MTSRLEHKPNSHHFYFNDFLLRNKILKKIINEDDLFKKYFDTEKEQTSLNVCGFNRVRQIK